MVRILSLFAASVIFGLVVCEIWLRTVTPFPLTESSNKKDHPQLLYTLHPRYKDIDEGGFRNKNNALKEADLAIIGDSHTYGENVPPQDNFPSRVAAKTKRNVYNFGIGGYGIYQYKVLLDQATQHKIKDVILALYLANDLQDNCRLYNTPYWQKLSDTEGFQFPPCRDAPPVSIFAKALKVLSQTATFQVAKYAIWRKYFGHLTSPESHFLFDQNQAVLKSKVIRQSQYGDLGDSIILKNFNNSKRFILESQKSFAEKSIGFAVLIIPSKQRVLYQWAQRQKGKMDAEFMNLMMNEVGLAKAYQGFFKENKIPLVDATPHVVDAFATALKRGENIYPAFPNDHPYGPGYEAYAAAAIEALALVER